MSESFRKCSTAADGAETAPSVELPSCCDLGEAAKDALAGEESARQLRDPFAFPKEGEELGWLAFCLDPSRKHLSVRSRAGEIPGLGCPQKGERAFSATEDGAARLWLCLLPSPGAGATKVPTQPVQEAEAVHAAASRGVDAVVPLRQRPCMPAHWTWRP